MNRENVVGIIAEYNPFHNGHIYHIEESKRRCDADRVIVILSGDFVQRGAPALMDKYSRTAFALAHGADLVLMLPVSASAASAETFASCGVQILSALGCVTHLSFGCEISAPKDFSILQKAASLLADEPLEYKNLLSEKLKTGLSYPAACEAALRSVLPDPLPEHAHALLSSPNNILALEYMKAVRRFKSPLIPVGIARRGSYHDEHTVRNGSGCRKTDSANYPENTDNAASPAGSSFKDHAFLSANAIRTALLENSGQIPPALKNAVPADVFRALCDGWNRHTLLRETDMNTQLGYALITRAPYLLSDYPGQSDRIRRILALSENYHGWEALAAAVKTKNITYTAVSRLLTQILLNITEADQALLRDTGYAPYARVLGFRRSSSHLLSVIREPARIPIIMKLSTDRELLNDAAARLLSLDLRASDLCRQSRMIGGAAEIANDFRQPLVIL